MKTQKKVKFLSLISFLCQAQTMAHITTQKVLSDWKAQLDSKNPRCYVKGHQYNEASVKAKIQMGTGVIISNLVHDKNSRVLIN